MNKVFKKIVVGMSTMAIAVSMFSLPASAAKTSTKQRWISGINSDAQSVSQKASDLFWELNGKKLNSIIITTSKDFPDAISAGYLSSQYNAPILYDGNEKSIIYINNRVEKNGTVYIIGGEAAVPKSFEQSLKGYKVVRCAGNNRYDTNLDCLKKTSANTKSEILICSATNYPDALSASAAKLPIMIVDPKALNSKQLAYLKSGKTRKFTIIGGTGAVSNNVATQLKNTFGSKNVSVDRRGGSDRYETCELVMQKYRNTAKTWVIADGFNFQGALTGAAIAGKTNAAIVLTGKGLVNNKRTVPYRKLTTPTMKYFVNYKITDTSSVNKNTTIIDNKNFKGQYETKAESFELGIKRLRINGNVKAKTTNIKTIAEGYCNILKNIYPSIKTSASGMETLFKAGQSCMIPYFYYDENGIYTELHITADKNHLEFTSSAT